METKNNFVDGSCFFIFEATGDSESDHFVDPNNATTFIDRDGGDINDAESCSHDDDDDDSSNDHFPFVNNNSNEANGSFCFYDNNVQVCIDDREEEGEEAHSYNPTWPHEPHNKNNNNGHKNSHDSSHEELLSEMEKNKLFWETCLAS